MNRKAVELEAIKPSQERELERHQHLYELEELSKMEKKLRKMESEKIRLL